MSVKIMTAREAMDLVPDGATVATGGFIGRQFRGRAGNGTGEPLSGDRFPP